MDPLNVFLFLILGMGIPFAFAAFVRQKRHKETLAMIEKGLMEAPKQKSNGKGALRWGIVISFLGIALTLGLYPLGWVFSFGNTYPLNFGPWMLLGLVPAFFGLSLIVVYFVTQDKSEEEEAPSDKLEKE
ncbi:MAG TPA: DUF6249 domain-containing protein [Anaerolineales bacterium]|nr:DUF6249 domain-containing protein [Anaerolineales bacterium]